MYYVMSDIHGEYEKYKKMLDLIHFSDRDTLFVLGDVVDRGPHPVKVLKDMMTRSNVYPIMGNHEFIALYVLEKLNLDITEENLASLTTEDIADILAWLNDGGETTLAEFQKLSKEERQNLMEYLSEFSWYETIDIGSRSFILVHAGLGNFRRDKKLCEYSIDELLETRADPNNRLFDDKNIFLIVGHTPTPLINGIPEIYHGADTICIDCGACFEGGKLACLCLNTMQEFYI